MPDDLRPTPALAAGFQLMEVDPAFNADPMARLDPLREAAPVRRDPVFPDVVTAATHEAVRAILNDASGARDLTKAREGNLMSVALRALFTEVQARTHAVNAGHEGSPVNSFFFMDEPDHGRLRGIVGPLFLKRVAAFRPNIEKVVNETLAGLEGRASFDAVAEYAVPIPVRVIAEVMGVADHDLPRFKAWSDDSFLMFNPMRTPEEHQRCIGALAGLYDFFADLTAARKAEPRDDLISDLVRAQGEGAPISDAEIVVQMNMLLTAGNVTTTDLISSGVYMLLTHPDARARLLAEPALISSTVEEVLRTEPPATRSFRFAGADGAVGGCPVRKGDMLSALIMAANYDPAVFAEPHTFDIARKPNPHLTFGGGGRICLGAPLARLEGQLALFKLFQRFPNLRRTEEGPPERRPTPGQRGPSRLPVSVV